MGLEISLMKVSTSSEHLICIILISGIISVVDEASPSEDEAVALAALHAASPQADSTWNQLTCSALYCVL